MTDEAIILETLKFVNRETRNKPYVNIIDTLWREYEIDKQEHLKREVLKRGLINLNMDNQWEFQLRSEGILFIEVGDKKLEKDFLDYLKKQNEIEPFMVNNFIKPDPTSPNTTNETDNGVIFLKSLKRKGLVDYDAEALAHVNTWYVDGGETPQIKRWFDTLHEPFYVNSVALSNPQLETDFQSIISQYASDEKSEDDHLDEPLVKKFLNELNCEFYLAGSMWDGENQSKRFYEENIWETGYGDGSYADIINNVSVGDILIIKSTFAANSISWLRVKALGRVTQNVRNGVNLGVDWRIKDIEFDIEDLGHYRNTIAKVNHSDLITIFSAIDIGLWSNLLEQKKSSDKEVIAGLLSDTESGDDFLDIMKDVSAFSRVIAAKSFEPPLAIALFGRWGSGKSFFMQKLREDITILSLRPTDTYCKGIVHIHFNAWSYMDANLWASIVSRIFDELHNYISVNTISDIERKEVERQLTSKLSIAKEEIGILESKKDVINQQIESLNEQKENLSESLKNNIDKIKETTISAVIENVDAEFKAKEKIEEALNDNIDRSQSGEDLRKIVPEKYWDNPSAAYAQIKSARIFLKEFFRKDTAGNNLIWTIAILIIILLAPILINKLYLNLTTANFTIPQIGISLLISFGAMWKRAETIYDRIQPIAASFWKIKETHNKQTRQAVAQFEQEEKALKLKIENDRAERIIIDQMIQHAESMKIDLEFRINNALATETLYSFIERRSKSEDYKKHLGILSMIRKDFEILNDLITGHKKELSIQREAEEFKSKFTKPLERIILYVDDLDRCPEENVVQVLEAVNLLMAYRLFIVIVGVDQRWVKNALVKRHYLQFSGRIDDSAGGDNNLNKIEPSDYLEKIFQIPFHLKNASDETVKQMIGKLAGREPDLRTERAAVDQRTANDQAPRSDSADNNSATNNESKKQNFPTAEDPALENTEALVLTSREIELMQALSQLIGGNPRAVKRFVNIYRIVKTYEGLTNETIDQELQFLAMMFLIALSVGPLKNDYKFIIDHLKTYLAPSSNQTSLDPLLSDLFEGITHKGDELKVKGLLNNHILQGKDAELIRTIPLHLINKYLSFTDRFVFKNI